MELNRNFEKLNKVKKQTQAHTSEGDLQRLSKTNACMPEIYNCILLILLNNINFLNSNK